jgi:hypothetical protein
MREEQKRNERGLKERRQRDKRGTKEELKRLEKDIT